MIVEVHSASSYQFFCMSMSADKGLKIRMEWLSAQGMWIVFCFLVENNAFDWEAIGHKRYQTWKDKDKAFKFQIIIIMQYISLKWVTGENIYHVILFFLCDATAFWPI